MKKDLILTYIALVIVTLSGLYIVDRYHIAYPLEITTTSRSTELSVVGEGKVDVVPDTATITAGITVNKAASVDAAQQKIDTVHNTIIAEMKQLGINEEDITTSGYAVNPNYSYDNRERTIDGYNASSTVTIKSKDVDLVSEIVNKATSAGANQINGIRFSVDDPSKLREEARSKAIANAKEEASKLSKELGISLGKVTNIYESSHDIPQPYYSAKADMALETAEMAGPQVEPGSQEITSSVTVFFEIR